MFRRSLVLAFALSLLLVPASALAQDADAALTIVHAALDEDPEFTTVDVYAIAGGEAYDPTDPPEPLLEDFVGGDIVGPVEIAPDDYRVVITFAGEPNLVVYDEVVTVPAGLEASLVAQYDPEGGEQLIVDVFVDDLSPTACDEARVVVRHVALEGPVDIFVDGELAADDVSNGDELLAELPAGTYDVLVTAAGDADDVIFDGALELAAGVYTSVYAATEFSDDAEFVSIFTGELEVGAEECPVVDDDEDDVVDDDNGTEEDDVDGEADEVEEIEQPVRVDSGTGGTAGTMPALVLLLALLGLALVSAPVVAARRR